MVQGVFIRDRKDVWERHDSYDTKGGLSLGFEVDGEGMP